MIYLVSNPTSSTPAVSDLRERMDHFYASTKDYLAFQATVQRDSLYLMLQPLVDAAVADRGTCRILELGAGRTGYPEWLAVRDVPVEFDAQDITPTNLDYLRQRCRTVHLGDISRVPGQYDLVLSTYVFEHVTNPGEFLAEVERLLVPGGWHVIVCPRYDLPGYLCPSLRHLGLVGRIRVHLKLWAARGMRLLDDRPRFWVNCDPSMFHGPWYRDADAVHLVSRGDVERWHRARRFDVRRLSAPVSSAREFVLQRLLTLSIACRKAVVCSTRDTETQRASAPPTTGDGTLMLVVT